MKGPRKANKLGPFELTKLASQISGLMEAGTDTKDATAAKPSVAGDTKGAGNGNGNGASGKAKTMGNWAATKLIVQKRGFIGLYSGFHLHLCT